MVIVQDGTAISGGLKVGRVIDVYPGNNGKVRNTQDQYRKSQLSIPLKAKKNEEKMFLSWGVGWFGEKHVI